MIDYSMGRLKPRWKKLLVAFLIITLLLTTGAAVAIRRVYYQNLRPVSSSEKSQLITVPVGSTPHEIALLLEREGVIRKSWAFEWYIRSHGVRDDLKAGTYALKPSQSVEAIVAILTHGRIATDLVTIFPAKRIDEVRDDLINQGFDASQVDAALDPSQYADHPALVDKPREANLEGYLYPESFEKTAQTTASDIIKLSLDQMHRFLTPEVREGIVRQGLTVHEGIILASIVEQEVGHKDPAKDLADKKMVAQVFLSRLKRNIALESDATDDYGAVLAGADPDTRFSSVYNTYEHPGLTPTPISNVGKNSLLAVSEPAQTDFLYFVTGDDCVNRFSRTLGEHEAFQRQHGVGCD